MTCIHHLSISASRFAALLCLRSTAAHRCLPRRLPIHPTASPVRSDPGYYSAAGAASCTKCPVNQFSPVYGLGERHWCFRSVLVRGRPQGWLASPAATGVPPTLWNLTAQFPAPPPRSRACS